MLFLTYIQGPIVNEWVKGVNAWLRGQIINQRWAPTDERLWTEVFNSFNRQFANVMEQEDTQAALAKGLQLEKGDLDKLITEFEQLVRHAGYDVNQDLVVTFFLLTITTVHITDYHWDRHSYFVIHPHHAQTMTHTPPSDDSLLVHLLVVPAACDSD
jgi:hypothetical protein